MIPLIMRGFMELIISWEKIPGGDFKVTPTLALPHFEKQKWGRGKNEVSIFPLLLSEQGKNYRPHLTCIITCMVTNEESLHAGI
jgi:hypothetical protein